MSKLNQNGAKMSISTLLSSPKLFCYRIDMFRLCLKMTEKVNIILLLLYLCKLKTCVRMIVYKYGN